MIESGPPKSSVRSIRFVLLLLCMTCSLKFTSAAEDTKSKKVPDENQNVASSDSPKIPDTAGANILFVAPFGSKSHKIFYDGIVEAIANGGHKVTILTPFKTDRKHKNVKNVVFENNDIAAIMANPFKDGMMSAILKAMEEGPAMCFSALSAQKTKSVLQKKYDLVFVSVFFNECFLRAVHSMNVPIVFVNPAEMFGPFTALRMGNPMFPSFNYSPMLNYEVPLTIVQRLVSMLSGVAVEWMVTTSFKRIDVTGESLKLYPVDSPSTEDMSANASLYIANSVRLAEHPRPYMPNILLAGGIHCRPANPLPNDLEKWVSSSGDAGFIFFSLGSAVRPNDVPDETVKMLVSVFKSLPQKILWKYNLDQIPGGLPDNVKLIKWAPQQDLLGHPKMRLFITHGGILSTQEATYHGVPVLGLPVFGDQEGNMRKAELQGWGKKLSWTELTYDSFRNTILHLLDDPESRRMVDQLRRLMLDRLSSPAEEVAWWTGYLIRTGGAPHLRSGALQLAWYELYNLDVWLLLLAVALVLLRVQYAVLKFIYRRCCGPSVKTRAEKIKKN